MLGNTTRDRRSERHAATRLEILDAAWEICRTEGLAGLSLRDVARRVGMQAPSLYSYFDSKHAIYDAMFAQGAQQFVDSRPRNLTGDVVVDLKQFMRYFVEFCVADPVRYQLLFQRTIPGFEPSAESYAISVDSLAELAAWFESVGLGAPGVLDLYTALLTGLTDQQISNDPGGDRWTRLIDDAAVMFVGYARTMPAQAAKPRRKR
jgi:AcrR family transcriptional regulator